MGGEWLDAWERDKDEREERAMGEIRDWFERKYGPDPADVAVEKQRAFDDEPMDAETIAWVRAQRTEEPDDDEWPDGEDSELVVVDEDSDVDDAKLDRHDRR